MSRFAVLSDVHGNLEALQAVLQDLEKQDVEQIWFLGDLINYGPDPVPCIQTLLGELRWPVRGVRGNNDHTAFAKEGAKAAQLVQDLAFHGVVVDAQRRARIEATELSTEWTLDKLGNDERALLGEKLNEQGKLWAEGTLLVHASPCDPIGSEGNYLRGPADAEEAFFTDKVEGTDIDLFRLAFFGHTHHAGVFRQFTDTRPYENVEYLGFGRFAGSVKELALDGQRLLVNPGSVGQPRDGDQRAAYAVFDTSGKIEFHRVAYPVDATIGKLRELCDPARGGQDSAARQSMVSVLVQRLQEAG